MDKVRLDKWLWAARFYKNRGLAVEAINGGHVHVNGNRVKPSRQIQIGDAMRISKGQLVFILDVTGLSEKRGSASQASLLYKETAESIKERTEQAELRKQFAATVGPKKRPDKRARRKIIRFINKNQLSE
ncbi:MAG: S4 domain-containing protein [Gammaproteobacteria bacterium]|nr:S4 domain-containing protein [Gammaproteobacteria bacterium]